MIFFFKVCIKLVEFIKFDSAKKRLFIISGWYVKYISKYRIIPRSTYIDPTVQLFGVKNIKIGNNTILSQDVWINVNHRNDDIIRLIIGDNCHIGHNNYFSCGPSLILKDYVFTGINCNFLGCGHKINDPSIPYIASGLTEGKAISIGVNCWISTSVTVMQGVQIGHGSVIGANSLILEDIPPFSIVVGNPGKVIKRFNFIKNEWVSLSEWVNELDLIIPTEEIYLNNLKRDFPNIPDSIRSSSRRFGWI